MESVLKPKKTPKADLEQKRFIYFEIALLLVLGMVYFAFNWTTVEAEDFYFSPQDTSNMYIAKEVYVFKPIADNAKPQPNKQTVKPLKTIDNITPIKTTPVKVTPIVTPVKPVDVTPTNNQKRPDTSAMKNSSEPLPANMIKVDKKPEFPGGEAAMYDFLRANLKYPDFSRKNGYSGPVYLSFYVSATGGLRDVIVLKGVRNSGLDAEVVRVFKTMPPWVPGERKGRPVDFYVTFPVRFDFEN
ncbi:MAG: TonB family protein [Sphingobacteriales bacterium JAD_PAG50586_3]|nr:MAG: TonB family protein [Sphingobacteriales bacterium JAD_PAG50586_3]